ETQTTISPKSNRPLFHQLTLYQASVSHPIKCCKVVCSRMEIHSATVWVSTTIKSQLTNRNAPFIVSIATVRCVSMETKEVGLVMVRTVLVNGECIRNMKNRISHCMVMPVAGISEKTMTTTMNNPVSSSI